MMVMTLMGHYRQLREGASVSPYPLKTQHTCLELWLSACVFDFRAEFIVTDAGHRQSKGPEVSIRAAFLTMLLRHQVHM